MSNASPRASATRPTTWQTVRGIALGVRTRRSASTSATADGSLREQLLYPDIEPCDDARLLEVLEEVGLGSWGTSLDAAARPKRQEGRVRQW